MGLRFLEHLLILTHDPDGTRDWFCENLGFKNGYHPEFVSQRLVELFATV